MGVGALVCALLQPYIQARRGATSCDAILLLGYRFSMPMFLMVIQLLITALFCGFMSLYIQAVFPGIIKAWFGQKTPIMMGLYSAMLMGGGALGAQLSLFLRHLMAIGNRLLLWFALPAERRISCYYAIG